MFCSCRCHKSSRSIGSAEKFAQGSQLYAAGSTFGARVPSPHRLIPMHTRPQNEPVFSTTGSSVPTLVNTLSYYHSPSTKPFILTPYSSRSHYRASGASLVSRGVGSTTSFVSNPYHRLRTCIIFRQLFLYMHGQLLILHHDDYRQRHNRRRDERLVAI